VSVSGTYIFRLDLGESWRHLQLELVAGQMPAGLLNSISPTIGSPARIHSITGRWLLWNLLREYLPAFTDRISIKVNGYGRPILVLPGNEKAVEHLSFSITHAEGQAVAILTDQCSIGIDIEHRTVIPYEDCRMVFSEMEWQQIVTDKGNHTFYRYWTAKEALCKAEGVGLIRNLSSLDLSNWPADAAHFKLPAFPGSGRPWYLQSITNISDYTLSLASSMMLSERTIQWRTFHLEDMVTLSPCPTSSNTSP
jgi:phosphopantetheinyl transferase (holo-ACP synthase)